MSSQKVRKFLIGLFAAVVCLAAEISPEQYLAHIKYLASPELKGRASGSPELDEAARYIACQFQRFGLQPVWNATYYQPFSVTIRAHLGPRNHIAYSDGRQHVVLKVGKDFLPFNFSGNGDVTRPLVFAGYGITAPEYRYDDYAGVDVKDKVVLVLRHEPQEFDDRSPFAGRIYTTHSQLLTKALNAEAHGARAVVFVNDMSNHRGEPDELEQFSDAVGPAGVGIPFVAVKAEIAERWVAAAGKNLDTLCAAIDQSLHSQSFALPGSIRLHITTDIERETKFIPNVVGFIPGLASEYLIIGAHYDHIGLGYQFSMAPELAGTVHPGADDNASGTAGVIELARWFSNQPKLLRGIVFVAFAGEEVGLLGSSYYVSHPPLPLRDATVMINLDMIGRIRERKVFVGDTGTSPEFKSIIEDLNRKYMFNLDFSDTDGYGSSDHFSFVPKNIPVLFFFSGLHSDYHRPADTWEKITPRETARLLELIGEVSYRLASVPLRPSFAGWHTTTTVPLQAIP
jgi:hypothetical protein